MCKNGTRVSKIRHMVTNFVLDKKEHVTYSNNMKRISPTFENEVFASIEKLAKLKDRKLSYLVRQWTLEGLERERSFYRQNRQVKDVVTRTRKQEYNDIENMLLDPCDDA